MVGTGGFGAHRRRAMRETGLFNLVAAYDINPEALKQAEQEDGARPTASFEELLETKNAEALIISTGASSHAAQIMAALRRGLHVFVEKPLASSMDDMLEILKLERETGLVIGSGHVDHSTDAPSLAIRDLIASGELGEIVSFESSTAHSGGFHLEPGDWRGDRKHNPGGMLFHCGVHKIHELAFYFGPVRRVRALIRYDLHSSSTADVALCQIELANGILGTLNAYHITPNLQSIAIYGTKAAIFRDERPWPGEQSLMIQRIPQPMDGSVEARVPLTVQGKTDPCGNLRSFHRAITSGSHLYPSALDAAHALAPVIAAAESAANGGTWIEIPTLP